MTGKQLNAGQCWNFFGRNPLKFYLNWGHFYEFFWFIGHRVTESQSDRHPSVLSIRVGEIIFVPDFNKLPYSLRSQGDNVNWFYNEINKSNLILFYFWCYRGVMVEEGEGVNLVQNSVWPTPQEKGLSHLQIFPSNEFCGKLGLCTFSWTVFPLFED